METTVTMAFIAPPATMALFMGILGVYLIYAVTKFVLSLFTGG